MRAIVIEPAKQQVSVQDINFGPRSFREILGSTPHRVGRLPNGDVILAAAETVRFRRFSIGGSHAMNGPAIVIGAADRFREHRSAKSAVRSIKQLVRWVA
jgi:hypothetical protein